MFLNRLSRASIPGPGAITSPRPMPVFQQIRPIVTRSVLALLARSPWAASVDASYGFQRLGKCAEDTLAMNRRTLDHLETDGQVSLPPRPESPGWLQRTGKPQEFPDLRYRKDPGAGELATLVAERGPCTLTLAKALQPGQDGDGDGKYNRYHCVMLLSTFEADLPAHGGMPARRALVGVIVDGNDLQQSKLMDKVRTYANQHCGGRLEDLTREDWEAIDRMLEAEGSDLRVAQLRYRFVDLRQMLAASWQKQAEHYHAVDADPKSVREPWAPDSVEWCDDAKVLGDAFTPDLKQELARACARDPSIVETFAPLPYVPPRSRGEE